MCCIIRRIVVSIRWHADEAGGLDENENVDSELAGLGLYFLHVLLVGRLYAILMIISSHSFILPYTYNLLYVQCSCQGFGICQQTKQTHVHDHVAYTVVIGWGGE